MLAQFREWVTPTKEAPKDVLLVPLADLHTCGTTALFPYWDGSPLIGNFEPHKKMLDNGSWRFKHQEYSPTGKQYRMFRHFEKCAQVIAEQRKGKRLVIVENGDSIDGNHHHTQQITTANISEQNAVHIWLMKYFKAIVGFDKDAGDLLYIGAGTEAHDSDEEDTIAQALEANTLPDGADAFDFLPMNIKGREFWFLHQGAGVGKGINKGNSMVAYMKNKYFECLEDKRTPPDVIISGHYHSPHHATWTHNYKTKHYIILPPFQLKTRFGFRVAAGELDKVGIQVIEISENSLNVCEPLLLKEYPLPVIVE